MLPLDHRGGPPLLKNTLPNDIFIIIIIIIIIIINNNNNNNNKTEEINIRIMMDNRTYFSNLKLFKFDILSKRSKMKLYKTHTAYEGHSDNF